MTHKQFLSHLQTTDWQPLIRRFYHKNLELFFLLGCWQKLEGEGCQLSKNNFKATS